MKLGLKMASATLLVCSCAERRAPTLHPARDETNGALIVAYNRRVLAIANAEDHLLSLKGARTLSMMHLAVHDALNAIVPRYATYLELESAPGADPIAAAARAAHDVAVGQYPNAAAELARELDTWLLPLAEGPAKDSGQALGRAAAVALSKAREHDAWNAEGDYQLEPPGPGVYADFPAHSGTPPGFVFGSGWGRAKPFLLQGPRQFPLPPPPPLDSSAYAEAFEEVKTLGRFDSAMRSAEQTHIALWWKDFAENSMNRLAAEQVTDKADLWESARLFALINASIFDGTSTPSRANSHSTIGALTPRSDRRRTTAIRARRPRQNGTIRTATPIRFPPIPRRMRPFAQRRSGYCRARSAKRDPSASSRRRCPRPARSRRSRT